MLERSKPYVLVENDRDKSAPWVGGRKGKGSGVVSSGVARGKEGYSSLSLCVAPRITTMFCDEGWTDVTSQELTP